MGGSWGSVAERLGGGGDGALGFSLTGVSTLGFSFSFSIFSAGAVWEAACSDVFSDGATWVTPSADFEITATLVPGSTVSPSLATNCQHLR